MFFEKCLGTILLIMMAPKTQAQSGQEGSFKIPGIDKVFQFDVLPKDFEIDQHGMVTILAGPKTDLFVDPEGEYLSDNSPRALFQPDSVFQFSAKVQVDFQSVYDAGVLLLYQDEGHWAKLCFEYSPQNQPMIVSVVTRDVSDDSNSEPISGIHVYLRISGMRNSYAFHYSVDGTRWNFVRYFHLGEPKDFRIGLSTQSPTGESCKTVFSEIKYSTEVIRDLRNGK